MGAKELLPTLLVLAAAGATAVMGLSNSWATWLVIAASLGVAAFAAGLALMSRKELWDYVINLLFFVGMATTVFLGVRYTWPVWQIIVAAPTVGLLGFALALWLKSAADRQRLDRKVTTKEASSAFTEGDYWLFLRPFRWELDFQGSELIEATEDSPARIESISLGEVIARSAQAWRCSLKIVGGHRGDFAERAITDGDWQQLVTDLMHGAQRIVVLPSTAEGTFWELSTIAHQKLWGKTIFLVPPPQWAAGIDREAGVSIIRRDMTAALARLGFQLPPNYDRANDGHLFMVVDEGGSKRGVGFPATLLPDGRIMELCMDLTHADKLPYYR